MSFSDYAQDRLLADSLAWFDRLTMSGGYTAQKETSLLMA